MKKVSLLAVALFCVTWSQSARSYSEETSVAPTWEQRLESLEQRNAVLERKFENEQEAAAARAKEDSGVTTGKDGFQIKSNDGNYSLKISGLIQADYRDYLGDHGATQ